MNELKIYSVQELCELLGRCDKGVRKLIQNGELVKVPLGGRRYGVPAWSVKAWQEKYANRA